MEEVAHYEQEAIDLALKVIEANFDHPHGSYYADFAKCDWCAETLSICREAIKNAYE
jgi:hypothetical protein